MKVLISTHETQGQRENDFCFVPDGEIVKFGSECDRDEEADGDCGCHRSLVGVKCSKATTTFKVAGWVGTEEDWKREVEESYYREGWTTAIDNSELLKVAEMYPLGAILEKREGTIQRRDA